MSRTEPNIVNIPPGAAFLPTLVDALLSGELIEGFAPGNDPLALSSATIWLPTRRAVRVLASEFSSRFEGDAALLPTLRALGDGDDDALTFDGVDDPQLETAISPLKRHLILSKLVQAWAENLNPDQRELYQGQEIVMPSSLADAVWFAGDLAQLMDTVATEEVDWAKLNAVVRDEHAAWWQLTLDFLKIATEAWPQILAEHNAEDAAVLRAKSLRRQAEKYTSKGSVGPVIAAGSTGSIPATADLLKSIAHMQNGVVVLPGLDRDLDSETWEKVDLPDNERDDFGTAPGHPQYGLKQLLHHMQSGRAHTEIPNLALHDEEAAGPLRLRETLVSEALRPSFSTVAWQRIFQGSEDMKKITEERRAEACDGITLIEAGGDREEALAIALALRETLQDKSKTAALVTPDRNLARRVAVEMRRFGIDVDDSAGQPLRNRSAGSFVRLVLQVAFAKPDPIALVSLIKHPLARFGLPRVKARSAARNFELAVLRGAIAPPLAGEFHAKACAQHLLVKLDKKRIPASLKRISPDDWEQLKDLALKLDAIFAREQIDSMQDLSELARQTSGLLEACGHDETESLNDLYEGEDGKALYDFLGEMIDQGDSLEAAASEWPLVFDALLGHRVVRPLTGGHPRVSILGPLEARLQTYDRVVLGGLNEKTWPSAARNDPFLSRPMKVSLGLPPPERRTGLAAHDFQILLGNKDVVLTRATKTDNALAVASRWVQRLLIVAGEQADTEMKDRGQKYLDWVSLIDQPASSPKACRQPKPCPPLDVRPDRLSVTEIETWIADPYAIYAKHILKLSELAPLIREPDARERGTLYHKIMEDFVRDQIDPTANDALQDLLDIAEHRFNETDVPPEFAAWWWPRFQTIAAAFIDWQSTQKSTIKNTHVELHGSTEEGLNGFTLSGQVDRIDELVDGTFNLFDYKTGLSPKKLDVVKRKAPQLPLGIALAQRKAFHVALGAANDMAYVRLRPEEELKVDWIGSADDLAQGAWGDLTTLVQAYRKADKQYWSKARPISDKDSESDYDHLARVREWSTGDDGEETS